MAAVPAGPESWQVVRDDLTQLVRVQHHQTIGRDGADALWIFVSQRDAHGTAGMEAVDGEPVQAQSIRKLDHGSREILHDQLLAMERIGQSVTGRVGRNQGEISRPGLDQRQVFV